jgi:hypothetical protein
MVSSHMPDSDNDATDQLPSLLATSMGAADVTGTHVLPVLGPSGPGKRSARKRTAAKQSLDGPMHPAAPIDEYSDDPFDKTVLFDADSIAALRVPKEQRIAGALADTRAALEEALETIAERNMTVAALRVELHHAQAQAAQADADSADLHTLRELHAALQGEVEGLRAAGRTLTDRLQSATTRLAQAGLQLETLQREHEALHRQLDEVRAALTAARATRPEVKPLESQQAAERVQDLVVYIDGRKRAWQDMECALDEQRERLAELRRELHQREAREHAWRRQLHVAQAEIQRLRTRPTADGRFGAAPLEETPALRASAVDAGRKEQASGAALVVLLGQSRLRYRLAGGTVTIGRSSANDIQLSTEYISRQHAVLRGSDDGYHVEDQGSRNGIMINGQPVRRQLLRDGDEMVLGETTFRFEAASAPDHPTHD